MSLEDAEKLSLHCLKETMEEKINKNNVEVMVIDNKEKKVSRMPAEKVEAILGKLKWSDLDVVKPILLITVSCLFSKVSEPF